MADKKIERRKFTSRHMQNPVIDGRTTRAKVVRDLFQNICSDRGGDSEMSQSEKELAHNIAVLSLLTREQIAHLLGQTGEFSLSNYLDVLKTMNYSMKMLGLERKQKNVQSAEDSFKEYVQQKG